MSKTLENWAGAARMIVALVFTDIVGSTALANLLGDEKINDVREAHFNQARRLIERYDGCEIKTIGDSFMVVFYTVIDALEFALSLSDYTGDEQITVRVGIHVGPVRIAENDVSGKMVNFTSRLVGWPKDNWIILSDDAKKHIEDELSSDPIDLSFFPYLADNLKGFSGIHKIWHVQRRVDFSSWEINQDNLVAYLHDRFPDREHADSKSISAMAEQLREAGHKNFGDIERAIKKGWKAFLAWEPRRYVGHDIIIRSSNVDLRLSDVGAIRSLFYIVDENFRKLSGNHFSASQMERIEEARELLKK